MYFDKKIFKKKQVQEKLRLPVDPHEEIQESRFMAQNGSRLSQGFEAL